MTPEPDPPVPTLRKLTVNVANAQGVKYLGDYTSFAKPDLQTYSTFKVDGVDYTITKFGIAYLAIDRSANSGDSVSIGFFAYTTRGLYYDGEQYGCNAQGEVTADYGASSLTPVSDPANTELDAMFNDPNVLFELEVIQ